MKKAVSILLVLLAVSACSPLDIAGKLLGGGGGPNIAAQVGKTNNQGVNLSNTTAAPTVTVRPKGRIDRLDQSQTTNISLPPWSIMLMLMLAIGGTIGWIDNFQRWVRGK